MDKQLRAYSVQGDETGCVVFAKSHVEARRIGSQELDGDFSDVDSCRLAPEFDEFAPGPVPVKALLAAGWWQYCSGCGSKVSDDDEYFEDEEETIPLVPIFIGTQSVFCSQSCLDRSIAEKAARKKVTEGMVEYALAKWPGIVVLNSFEYTIPPSMMFTFPGGKYPVNFKAADTHVSIIAADKEAWEAFSVTLTTKKRRLGWPKRESTGIANVVAPSLR